MSSVNKRCAAPAAHRAPRKRPSHRRSRWPGARVFWAFQRGADFSASPTYPEFSAPHRFTFPACPDFSVSPACPEFSVSPARSKSSAPPRFVFPACLEFSVFPDYLESSSPHRAPRKHPFRLRSRWPGARVFWAFQRSAGFYASPTYLEFLAQHRFTFPACPDSSVSPACQELSVFPDYPESSSPDQAPRKRPFRRRSRRPGARVFWAFQRSAGFSVFPPCPELSALPAHPEFPAFPAHPDFSALAAPPVLGASDALLRRAIACGERSGRDQPFGAHAS